MNSIFYLWRTQLKNRILALKKNPGLLVMYTLSAVMFVFLIIMSFSTIVTDTDIPFELSEKYLSGVSAALFLFFSYSVLLTSFNKGTTFFTVSDVHLLFSSPVPPKNILTYGIIKQMGMSLIAIFFVALQGVNLSNLGISDSGLISLYLGLFFTLFMSYVTTSVIYSYINSNSKRILIAKLVFYGILISLGAAFILEFNKSNNAVEAGLSVANSPYFDFIPIFGWAKGLFTGIFSGDYIKVAILAPVIIVYSVIMCILISKNDGDFYEDVLGAAEKKAELKALQKADGGTNAGTFSLKKKVKVRDTGIKKGSGASALFYKQMLETKRKGIFFIDSTTLIVGFTTIVVTYTSFMSDGGSIDSFFSLIMAFSMAGYMYLFFSTTGTWALEIKKPFIYMLPDNNFKKLIFASLSGIIKSLADGILIFFICGIITKLPVWQWIICAASFTGFSLIYKSGDILCHRIFKRTISTGVLRFLYFMMLMVLVIPSVIGAVISGIMFYAIDPSLTLLCLMVFLIINVLISGLIIFLSRNLLQHMELE